MTKRISWLVSLSCIVLVLMLSFVFVGCKETKYTLKIESQMGGEVSIVIGNNSYQLEDLDSKTYEVKENAVVTLKATAKSGYEFEKWVLNDGFSYSDELKLNINADSTYVAVFTPVSYTLVFKHNGNIVGQTDINVSTTNINYPAMNGYENVTWEEVVFENAVNNNIVINTLTATPINYTITFNKEDGSVLEEAQTWNVENKTIVVPAVPEKLGYDGVWASYSLDELGDKVISPVYSIHNYTLTFIDGEDDTIKTQTININSVVADIVYPELIGYDVGAWDISAEDLYNDFIANPRDMVVKHNGDIIEYTLSCKFNGEVIEEFQITVKTDLNNLKSTLPAEYNGYENIIWEEITFDKTNPSDLEIEATSYDLTKYTLIYKKGDKEFGTKEITVETDLTAITGPETPGYEGVTWEEVDFTKADTNKNIVINALTATPINYTITFKAEDDSVIQTINWNVENTTITTPDVPAKEGYTAVWQEYNFDVIGNIEVKPVYTIIDYTITFYDETGNVVGEVLTWNIENKNITAPAVPVKTGYVGAWEYNFDTCQNINVVLKYSKSMNVKYYFANGNDYQGSFENNYIKCDIITIIETINFDNPENPVSTIMVDDRIAGHSLVTVDQFVDYLKRYSDEYDLVKIGDSADLVQGVINAYDTASLELNVYFD